MSQREAIAVWLLGGGVLAPVVILAVASGLLGSAALPLSLVVLGAGVGCLVAAKLPLIRSGIQFSIGPSRLRARERHLYWLGYALVAAGIVLALFASRWG